MARGIRIGGGNVIHADLQKVLGDIRRYKGETAGAQGALPFILPGRNLVVGDVKVPEVDGGERFNVHLKILPVCPRERRVKRKVERGQLDQVWEPVGRDLSLNQPDIYRPLLVFSSHNS